MGLLTRMALGADLSQGMAERLGVDLDQAFANSSDVGVLALQNVVMRCAACRQHNDCMEVQKSHATLREPPEYCRNTALFQRLARR